MTARVWTVFGEMVGDSIIASARLIQWLPDGQCLFNLCIDHAKIY